METPAAARAITDPVTRPFARSCMNMERNSRLPVGWVQRSSVEGGSLGGFRVLRRERRQLEIRLGFGHYQFAPLIRLEEVADDVSCV
jgi:hypothetical protein